MLTVEINAQEQRVELYFDEVGIEVLSKALERLRLQKQGHDHLMTPAWSGSELTDVAQGENTSLVNHLLLVLRPQTVA